ncbi:hypothetical protein EV421DRAFT_1145854 [Armillaria borealis]|uniref:Uncharacterized protein n=1 Tax=Armillaria borealis TaxID=47425 RepID=A0AA39J655_9AGAR|nr:hypothetical protein EV421DRAFT_1145854 [Armillaria borealis]
MAKPGAFCRRRETGGLTMLSTTLTQFTDICRILHRRNFPRRTSHHQILLRSPFSPLRRRGPMLPDIRLSFSGKQRRGVRRYGQRERDTPSSLRTTRPQGLKLKLRTPPFQSLYITSASFYKKIPNPSQQKATEAYDHSRPSTQPTLIGEMFTNPKVVSSVTDARISSSIPCDWHRSTGVLQSCLARLYYSVLHVNYPFSLFHHVSLANACVNLL